MTFAWLIIIALVWIFGSVVFFGAPYLPSLKAQQIKALDSLKLKPGQTVLELGCGDGRVAKLAAQKGLKVIGYELNLLLVLVAKINTFRYRKRVKIIWGNYWNKQWPVAQGIFTFLLPTYMARLDKKIIQCSNKPVLLASVAFPIPHKKYLSKKDGVYVYKYS